MGQTWGILGSGFGGYGYLPALIRSGHQVLVPEANMEKFASRNDLKEFFPSINFLPEKDLLVLSSHLVIARRPSDQREIIYKNLSSLKSKTLFLEKPLAETNAHSIDLFNLLKENAVDFRIGFLADYSYWLIKLKQTLIEQQGEEIRIELLWKFKASHFRNKSYAKNWKASSILGGGCFNFFGSHIVHALAQLCNWRVSEFKQTYIAPNMDTAFEICLVADSLKANVLVDSNSDSPDIFEIMVFLRSDCLYQFRDNGLFPMPRDYETVDPRSELIFNHINSTKKDNILIDGYCRYLALEKMLLKSYGTNNTDCKHEPI